MEIGPDQQFELKNPLGEVVMRTTSSFGDRQIKIGQLVIALQSERTHFQRTEDFVLSEVTYTAVLGGNRVLRGIYIYATRSRRNLDAVVSAFELCDETDGGHVQTVLDPVFRGLNQRLLKKAKTRSPAEIGAVVQTGDHHVLFQFHVFRGAVRAAVLPDELRRSVRIET